MTLDSLPANLPIIRTAWKKHSLAQWAAFKWKKSRRIVKVEKIRIVAAKQCRYSGHGRKVSSLMQFALFLNVLKEVFFDQYNYYLYFSIQSTIWNVLESRTVCVRGQTMAGKRDVSNKSKSAPQKRGNAITTVPFSNVHCRTFIRPFYPFLYTYFIVSISLRYISLFHGIVLFQTRFLRVPWPRKLLELTPFDTTSCEDS